MFTIALTLPIHNNNIHIITIIIISKKNYPSSHTLRVIIKFQDYIYNAIIPHFIFLRKEDCLRDASNTYNNNNKIIC